MTLSDAIDHAAQYRADPSAYCSDAEESAAALLGEVWALRAKMSTVREAAIRRCATAIMDYGEHERTFVLEAKDFRDAVLALLDPLP